MFNKNRDISMEHYKEMIDKDKKQSKEIRRLYSQLAQANKQIEKRDQIIYDQSVMMEQEKNRSEVLEKSTTAAQSNSASTLRLTSHALNIVNPN
ncbi:hypothetical protein WMW72_20310 [Paenibacillus filicis]|uniref:Uncharacterized protein n=1 Tax=Paenibacillus filicis TaxID=669464 RepID=A0ABU9DMZ9_9BACL